ncbi:strictosidine synthase domain-containing protein [Ditylenchus destructor]|uniref:Strictosidine synthase domain-containing protein n=1 Tax=Ditylenchus destructor TaxID=166010 RepID=A0AAD4N957_9BILA|nr:strictosidine synthase domain-containing protein [Ditylenchus destructor]
MVVGSVLLSLSVTFLALAILLSSNEFSPKEYSLPPPPELTGPLAVKGNEIKGEVRLLEGQVPGPESIVVEKDALYTCLGDGRCVKISIKDNKILKTVRLTSHTGCNGKLSTIGYCGRPLGLRRYNQNLFTVADAILGIYNVNFEKETSEVIISSEMKVDGTKITFPDDFDYLDNDTIVFSDASTRYPFQLFIVSFLEHQSDGRWVINILAFYISIFSVIQCKLSTHECHTLYDGLNFANGVQVHPDKQSILVSESAGARIHRYYFTGPKKGRREIFAENLPGFPDNVRTSKNGKSIYVALFAYRGNDQPSFFDQTARHPWIRKIVGTMVQILPEPLVHRAFSMTTAAHGVVVELDLTGKIIKSYHDTEGKVIQSISEVQDDGDKYLYLGSFSNKYIGRIMKY